MGKPWARYEIGFIRHPKFLALNANAIALWLEGKNYADSEMTDGLLPLLVVKHFRFYSKKAVDLLLKSAGPKTPAVDAEHYSPLWVAVDGFGYRMHDYLTHNDSREEVTARIERSDETREWDRRRKQLYRDRDFLDRIRQRDGDCCRYCGRRVNWADRRGSVGGTYDHIIPRGENTPENIVVACRGCNSVKGGRTPEEAGIRLRDAPISNPVSAPEQVRTKCGLNSRIKNPGCTEAATETEAEAEAEAETLALSPPPKEREGTPRRDGRSKRPIFTGQRIVVFEWFLERAEKILGAKQLDDFDIHEWFFALDAQAVAAQMVIPDRDNGAWLASQLVAEAQRRGLPMAVAEAPALGKLSQRMAQLVVNARREAQP